MVFELHATLPRVSYEVDIRSWYLHVFNLGDDTNGILESMIFEKLTGIDPVTS